MAIKANVHLSEQESSSRIQQIESQVKPREISCSYCGVTMFPEDTVYQVTEGIFCCSNSKCLSKVIGVEKINLPIFLCSICNIELKGYNADVDDEYDRTYFLINGQLCCQDDECVAQLAGLRKIPENEILDPDTIYPYSAPPCKFHSDL